jgi:hypothetical protein
MGFDILKKDDFIVYIIIVFMIIVVYINKYL